MTGDNIKMTNDFINDEQKAIYHYFTRDLEKKTLNNSINLNICSTQMERSDDGFLSNGSAGYLLYGPYITLAAGGYGFIIDFELTKANSEIIGSADVCCDNGNIILGTVSIEKKMFSNNKLSLIIPINIYKTTEQIECRVLINSGIYIKINNVNLNKVSEIQISELLDNSMSVLTNSIGIMNSDKDLIYYWPLSTNRKILGPILIFIRRIIRRLVKFLIEPILQKQTRYNNITTNCIEEITELIRMQYKINNKIEERLNESETKYTEQDANVEKRLNALESKYIEQDANVEKKLNALESKYIEHINDLNTNNLKQIDLVNALQNELGKCQFNAAEDNRNTMEIINNLQKRISDQEHNQNKIVSELANQSLHYFELCKENAEKVNILTDSAPELFNKQNNFWEKKSYAQSGEDAICAYIIMALGKRIEECSYIDLGANHAKEISNTYWFYKNGARGVLVEANPDLIPELKFWRNSDVILNKIISDKQKSVEKINIMSGNGLSTTDDDATKEILEINTSLKVVKTVEIETITVHEIIENYLGKNPDILNIDVEGSELKVIESIDFKKYRPLIIIIENIPYRPYLVVGKRQTDKSLMILKENGYIEYAFTGINAILIDSLNELIKERLNK
jgi:FkbM family methyltransferase